MAMFSRAVRGLLRARHRDDRGPGPAPERRHVEPPEPPPVAADPVEAGEPVELEELLLMADVELAEKQEQLDELDRRYQEAVEGRCRLEEENNRLRGRLTTVFRGLAPEDGPPPCALPATADSPSHAASLARLHLGDHLSLPPAACVELEKLDNLTESRTWGENAWRGFLALHAYGEALACQENPGNFRAWCENSHHRHVWPSNSKKLAMSESKTVGRSGRMSAKRMFPVDRAYDPSGAVFMEAHLKIGVGRGTLLPRVYFVADRETAKVYVGYFGPHKNLPNTLT